MVVRRARGYAPLPITLKSETRNPQSGTILSVGAHLKNTVALKIGSDVFVSQHLGDLATKAAHEAFIRASADLPKLYDAPPERIAHDLHPEYLSTKFALRQPTHRVAIQHHWAHVVACMVENEIEPPVLGVSWDGTGYGLDGTIWGGEFLLAKKDGTFERVAHFRSFRLPGGDQAVREPRRSALGVLYEIFDDAVWELARIKGAFAPNELPVLRQMLIKRFNSPVTTSAGRLFDAVAALVGLRQRTSFEGQAAMELEFAADESFAGAPYSFQLSAGAPLVVDWEPSIRELLVDIQNETPPGVISTKFHHMLSRVILATAQRIGERKVVLSGGCFQNRVLLERVIADTRREAFTPFWHQRIPPNDGGIALGQAVAASWRA
jgi:hydrogenase maturation protein HypF